MAYYPEFGDLLDRHLTVLDISGSQMARRLKVNPGTVTRWRNGESRPRKPEMVVRVADVLRLHGEERDHLLRTAGYAPPPTTATDQNNIENDSIIERSSIASFLPNLTPVNLINRDKSLSLAQDALQDSHGQWIIGIDGIGGIGKTALAQGIMQACQQEERFARYIWISATNGLNYEGVLNGIVQQLGVPSLTSLNEQEKEERVLMLLREHKSLIILDNLETASEDQDFLIARLFPLLNPSKAVCTSRYRFQGDVMPIHLEGLSVDATAQLIRQEAQARQLPKLQNISAKRAEEFTKISGGSPQIIKLAVGQATLLPFNIVMKQVRNARIGTRQKSEALYHNIYLPSWKLLSTDAQKLLVALSLLIPGEGGPFDLMMSVSGLDEDVTIEAIQELWQLSLVEVAHQQIEEEAEDDEPRYYLHPMTTQFVIQHVCGWQRDSQSMLSQTDPGDYTPTFDPAHFLQRSVARGMAYIEQQIADSGNQPPPVEIRQLAMGVLEYGLEMAELWPTTSQLIIQLAPSMEQAGHRATWISRLKRGVQQSQALQDVQTMPELNLHLGILHQLLGQYEEADSYYASSLTDFQLAQDTQGQARTMIRQAQKCRLQRHYGDASQLVERAFEFLAADDPERARGYTVLGEIAYDDDQGDEAIAYFEKALALWNVVGNQRRIAWSLTNLGVGLRFLERYDEAIACYEEAIAILGEMNEPVHWAATHMNWGNVFLDMEKPQESLRLYEVAEPIFEKAQDQLRLALVNYNCGIAYYDMRQWRQAREKYRLSIERCQQIENIELQLHSLNGLGQAHIQQKEYCEAKRIFVNMLDLLAQFEEDPEWTYLHDEVQQHLEEISLYLN